MSETTARQTPTASRATLAQARERLATSGRPVESEAQRRRRELAQARAVERAEEEARLAEEAAQFDKWALRGLGVGVLAFVGWVAWGFWRGGASA